MPLYLASHVYCCLTGGQLVLLDVRRNRYMGLEGTVARSLATQVVGWPAMPNAESDSAPHSEGRVRRSLEQLQANRVLTTIPPAEPRRPTSAPAVEAALVEERPGVRPRVRGSDTAKLLLATIRAVSRLRWYSLESTLEHIGHRKGDVMCSDHVCASSEEIGNLVTGFLYARSVFYRSRNNCVLDSLVLLEYLAARRVYANWVWGVRVAPFGAHCWIQAGSFVLNDLPENVRPFTPILSV